MIRSNGRSNLCHRATNTSHTCSCGYHTSCGYHSCLGTCITSARSLSQYTSRPSSSSRTCGLLQRRNTPLATHNSIRSAHDSDSQHPNSVPSVSSHLVGLSVPFSNRSRAHLRPPALRLGIARTPHRNNIGFALQQLPAHRVSSVTNVTRAVSSSNNTTRSILSTTIHVTRTRSHLQHHHDARTRLPASRRGFTLILTLDIKCHRDLLRPKLRSHFRLLSTTWSRPRSPVLRLGLSSVNLDHLTYSFTRMFDRGGSVRRLL